MKTAPDGERLALAHFASAYFKRGLQQRQELIELLSSDDINLVYELLVLLSYTVELGPNGEYQLDKPLGGSEIPPHISGALMKHPELVLPVASALGIYGPLAKNEASVLLRISLFYDGNDRIVALTANAGLVSVDHDFAKRFGLDRFDESMTNEQKKYIKDYLATLER